MVKYKKVSNFLIAIILIALVLLSVSCEKNTDASLTSPEKTPETDKEPQEVNTSDSKADKALAMAAEKKEYLFLMFYDEKDDLSKDMEKTVKNFIEGSSEKTFFYEAVIKDEPQMVKKYQIDRNKHPFLLVFTPNGAISGGFAEKVTKGELKDVFVSEIVMKILKTLQDQKIALILLQNDKTKFNKENKKAAEDFYNDERLKGVVEIISEDPKNKAIEGFLTQCKLDQNITESTIVLIAPPGMLVGTYSGEITKDTLINALSSSCGSGCGSGCN